jgi:hypothetical protein
MITMGGSATGVVSGVASPAIQPGLSDNAVVDDRDALAAYRLSGF